MAFFFVCLCFNKTDNRKSGEMSGSSLFFSVRLTFCESLKFGFLTGIEIAGTGGSHPYCPLRAFQG